MTDFHGRMMNAQSKPASMIAGDMPTYGKGFRDARHSCAEIALEADRGIEQLRAQLREAQQTIRALLAEAERRAQDEGKHMIGQEGE